jgi:ribosomal protein S18 acetylase RimI-like enzyme
MATKADKKALKRKLEDEEREVEKQRAAKRRAAMFGPDGVPRDVLADLKPFAKYERNGADLELFFTSPEHPSWTPELAKFVFDLTKANMQALYDAAPDWGWKEGKKRSELLASETRYVIARNRADSTPLAFVSFQFMMEGAFDVLYVWELQLAPELQRKGVGKHLMQTCELVARKAGMQLCMLTVLKNNDAALSFYSTKLKYEVDMTSPSVNDVEACYEILSKCIDAAGLAAVEARADRFARLRAGQDVQ